MKTFLLPVLLLTAIWCKAQQPMTIKAARPVSTITIDGLINEDAWKNAPKFPSLVEQRPTFGRAEISGNESEIYILYTDEAVYLGGILHETTNDSINAQLVGRDEVGVNDFVGIIFDTYQDKINALGFYVTPKNEQFDVKYGIGSEDMSWNTVYETKTAILDKGWSFEMRIPYFALRFAKRHIQDWNIQVLRRRAKSGQQYSWTPLDPTKFGFVNQFGTWQGLENIQPPMRLSFSPYFSSYVQRNKAISNDWKSSVNGGMDVKWGINDAFTMDMTLIPDFGQVQSDNQVLNLSPFEVRFNENRQFFNEGTELFQKGDLFYSRRIGSTPVNYYNTYNIPAGDTVLENPVQTKLLNATKISGRTKSKLGIGFFNAITRPEYATIQNSDKEQYRINTAPLTNYNILVLDQAMKNNSRVTLINTNTWRSGESYDANVTSIDYDLYDNKVNWNLWGNYNHSRLVGYEAPGKTLSGNLYRFFVGKFRGRFNFDAHRYFVDEKYNQNDMGYFTNNNYITHGFKTWYKWVIPKGFYNRLTLNISADYTQRHVPRNYQDAYISMTFNGQLKNLWGFAFFADYQPRSNDFYDPRLDGYVLKRPWSWMKGIEISSNEAKKYAMGFNIVHRSTPDLDGGVTRIIYNQTYRPNQKLTVSLNSYLEFQRNDYGFAFLPASLDSVVIGLRNRKTAENTLSIKYNFSNKVWLTFRGRHYWSEVHFHQLYSLAKNGETQPLSYSANPDYNYNFFNVDAILTWQFAQGSFVHVGWKNINEQNDKYIRQQYYRNLRNTIEAPGFNSFSVRVIYFLDYVKLKRDVKKSASPKID